MEAPDAPSGFRGWLTRSRRNLLIAGGVLATAVVVAVVATLLLVSDDGEPDGAVVAETTGPSPTVAPGPRASEPTAAPAPAGLPAIVDPQDLFVVGTDGSDEPRLIHRSADSIGEGVWSPDGSKIAFTAGYGPTSIYVAEVPEAAGEPLVQVDGSVVRLLWSSDGRYLSYHVYHSVSAGSVQSVYVLDTEGGEPTEHAMGDDDVGLIGWIPDSSELVLTYGGSLLLVDAFSGSESIISAGLPGLTGGRASLSPDGRQVAVSSDQSCALSLVNLRDGAAADVVAGACSIYNITWSPDETEIAYYVGEGERGTYVVNLAARETRRLTEAGIGAEISEWLADGTGLALVRCYEGCYEAVLVTAEGGGEERISGGQDDARSTWDFGGFLPDARRYVYSDETLSVAGVDAQASVALTAPDGLSRFVNLSLSPEGDRVAYVRTQNQTTSRHAVDWQTGEVIRSEAIAFRAEASPDGRLIAFISPKSPGSEQQLRVTNADGTGERVLVDADVAAFAWAPDGSTIAYTLFDAAGVGLVDVATGDVRELSLPGARYQLGPWSPDGSQLALVSFATSSDGAFPGGGDIVVLDVRSGAVSDVVRDIETSPVIGTLPAWSPDGEKLVYVVRDPSNVTHIETVEIATGQSRRLTQASQPDLDPAWSPDGRSIAFWRQLSVVPADMAVGLLVVSLDSGEERELARFTVVGGSLGNTPAWSPDGKLIAGYAPAVDDPGAYIVEADGAGMTYVIAASTNARGYRDLSWSADGSRIMITSEYQGI